MDSESGGTWSCKNSNNGYEDKDHFLSKGIVKTALYFVALASSCFLLCTIVPHSQYNISLSNNPFSTNTPNTATTISSVPFPAKSSSTPAPENLTSTVYQGIADAELEKILIAAAMESKTVAVTVVNAAWTAPDSLFEQLLESLRIGIGTQKFLRHLVVIALDQKAYARCLELHPHCFAITTEGVDFSTGQVFFMTPNYIKLAWRKIEVMYRVLKLGYNAIFTDADIVWFRDPLLRLLLDADIQTSCDHYKGTPTNGSSNTGFYYVKSNSRTIKFYEFWLASRDRFPTEMDQQVFNRIVTDPFLDEIGIKIRLLDTAFYGGFCEPSKDLNVVCTMHTNCCYGVVNKMHDLKMLTEVWKRYMALPSDEKAKQPQPWNMTTKKCG